MSAHLTREEAPVRYRGLVRYLPLISERAQALRVSVRLLEAIDDHQQHSRRALPAARVNLVDSTLAELELRLGDAEAAGRFLLEDNRIALLLQNGGADHRASILAAA